MQKNTSKLFSIIIPVLNAEQTIKRCVDAIIKQINLQETELIAVDCGSIDSTLNYLSHYPIEILSINDKNRSIARNFGAKKATGKILVFVDANTILADNFIEILKINRFLAHSWQGKVDLISEDLRPSKLSKFIYRLNYLNQTSSFENHNHLYPMLNSAVFAIRRNLFFELDGFDTKFLRWEDRELGARIIKSGKSIMYLDEAISTKLHSQLNGLTSFKKILQEAYYGNKYLSQHHDKKNKLVILTSIQLSKVNNNLLWHPGQKKVEYFGEIIWVVLNSLMLLLPSRKVYSSLTNSFMFSRIISVDSHSFQLDLKCFGCYFSSTKTSFQIGTEKFTIPRSVSAIIVKIYLNEVITKKEILLLKVFEKTSFFTLRKVA